MISGIIMASGFSKRMEKDKLTLEIDGITIIERVIQLAKESDLQEVILVYRRDEVGEIGNRYNLKTVHNPYAHEGQSRAMKLGIEATPVQTQGYMFFMGDQPFLKVEFINQLIHQFEVGDHPIIVPRYGGKKGSPTIFSAQLKSHLLSIKGDEGGRKIIKAMAEKVKYVDSVDPSIGQDIDTWEIYQQILLNSKS